MRMVVTLLLIFGSTVSAEDNNEWASNGTTSPEVFNEPNKYCSDDGDKLIFSNVSTGRAGFHHCGKLSFVALCDAEGNKWVGPAKNAPHGYLDCSLGPRIRITRHDPLPDFSAEKPKASKPLPAKGPELLNDYQDYMKMLDGILDIEGNEKPEQSQRSPATRDLGGTGDLPGLLLPLLKQFQELSSDR